MTGARHPHFQRTLLLWEAPFPPSGCAFVAAVHWRSVWLSWTPAEPLTADSRRMEWPHVVRAGFMGDAQAAEPAEGQSPLDLWLRCACCQQSHPCWAVKATAAADGAQKSGRHPPSVLRGKWSLDLRSSCLVSCFCWRYFSNRASSAIYRADAAWQAVAALLCRGRRFFPPSSSRMHSALHTMPQQALPLLCTA